MEKKNIFTCFATKVAEFTGTPYVFLSAFSIVIIWALSGPFFNYSDTWQLVINTGTTIITFLMVFLIQSTQNRDTKALQVKLDELIRVTEGAHNFLMDLEELSDEEIKMIYDKYEQVARDSREKMRNGETDTNKADVIFEKLT